MLQLLNALVALAEDPGLIPSTHKVVHNHPYSSFKGSNVLFWLPQAPNPHIVHIHTFRENTHKMAKSNFKNK